MDTSTIYMAPSKADRQRHQNYQFARYDGADQYSTDRKPANGWEYSNPIDYSARTEQLQLMAEARRADCNSPVVSGLLDKLALYTVGTLSYQSRTGDARTDRAYEDYFHAWSKESADITGRFTFKKMMSLAFRGLLRDGDCGLAIITNGNTVGLELIEGDRIGSPDEPQLTVEIEKGKTYFAGLTIEKSGKVSSYRIYRRTAHGRMELDREVKRDDFVHLWDPDRADDYRGVSYFAPVINHIRDLYEVLNFEKVAAKFASSYAGFISGKNPFANTGANQWNTNPTPTNPGEMDAFSGKIVRLGEGEDISFANGPDRPNNAFMNLVETLRVEIAQGLGLPIGFVTDFSRFGGVTARLESQQVMRAINRWQTMLVDKALDRIKNKVIANGIALKHIPSHPEWRQGNWQFASHITADIGHEVTANLSLLNAGIITRRQMIEEQGGDFRDVTEQLADEVVQMRDIAGDHQVPIEMINRDMVQATEMLAAANSEPEEPTIHGQIGDKGVAELLDLLEKVGTGVIDRNSAINNLVSVFGVPLPQAQAMVPQKANNPTINGQPQR
jgi:capsid protein